ncbi:response regulator transcription factor [Sinomicrobium weinanense]|uniref:Response regulator transcription factor n=1 Tax=Sinomicrobium weinanense TaxID=2842200 RepID=A0A926JUA8_9FLAO|nr:response regulator transcription factor [Sinomicrobium weinanense]MBC9797615.1 response regulator transcription factor [Sinomicrobium weinanense]MBU3123437.1 response regulator transcription factor [Sinomicrobium weinanense]
MKKILLIEDDPALNNNIKEAISSEGMEVDTVFDGTLAERILRKKQFDCVVLDINLPGQNGYEVCKNFREYNTVTPVLMLTAFGELEDKVKGFDRGADDYLTKPFYMRELLLRINALIKRGENDKKARGRKEVVSAGDITIHPGRKRVTRQGREISLTPREYQVLAKLVGSGGEVVSKKELVKEIWGNSFDGNTNTIEVYINFLRNKVDKPFGKDSIKTKVGYGYYFED